MPQIKGGWISLKIHHDFEGRNNLDRMKQNDVLIDSMSTNRALSANFKSNKRNEWQYKLQDFWKCKEYKLIIKLIR